MKLHILNTLGLSAAAALAMFQPAAAEYPERPINVIVNYGAGGSTDTSARILVEAMKQAMGSEIFVTNVTGAGGTVGTAQAAAANNDGYTLLYTPIGPVTVQPHLRNLSYNDESLVPVCGLTQNPMAIMVAPESPYQSVQDLIDAAKAGENIVAVGPAPGSIPHIAQAALASQHDVQFRYLPVGGGPKQSKAILAGDATVSMDLTSTAVLFGLRPIAVIADERIPEFDVPTVAELGINMPVKIWHGVFAPAGTPDDVVQHLTDACETASESAEFQEGLEAMNFVQRFRDHEEFAAFFAEEYEGNRELLGLIGIELK